MKQTVISISLIFIIVLAVMPVCASAAEQVDTIISGGTVVAMDASGTVIENGAVAVRRDRIVAVGRADDIKSKYKADKVIDARYHVVMPGLINTYPYTDGLISRHCR